MEEVTHLKMGKQGIHGTGPGRHGRRLQESLAQLKPEAKNECMDLYLVVASPDQTYHNAGHNIVRPKISQF